MKFVLIKGYEGFGDRLQCLLYVIAYAKVSNRVIVIDWTDEIWSNNEEYDFTHFFYLEDIDYLSLPCFKELYFNTDVKRSKILPWVWKDNLFNSPGNYIYGSEYILGIDNTVLQSIINYKLNDFSEEIVVYSSVKIRTFNYSLFNKHIRLKDCVLNYIKNTSFYKDIIQNNIDYCCIHLRGGDRMVSDPRNKYFNNSFNTNDYLKRAEEVLNSKYKNVLVLSDSNILINLFKNRNDKNETFNFFYMNNFRSDNELGIHKTKNSDKVELNKQLLTDFYLFSKANQRISDGVSLFSKMASNIKFYQ